MHNDQAQTIQLRGAGARHPISRRSTLTQRSRNWLDQCRNHGPSDGYCRAPMVLFASELWAGRRLRDRGPARATGSANATAIARHAGNLTGNGRSGRSKLPQLGKVINAPLCPQRHEPQPRRLPAQWSRNGHPLEVARHLTNAPAEPDALTCANAATVNASSQIQLTALIALWLCGMPTCLKFCTRSGACECRVVVE